MSLAPGTRLGLYEITGAIGAGGMGEVYRGRDATLNREVALKVLPKVMASDSERLAADSGGSGHDLQPVGQRRHGHRGVK